jgi:2-polyprenyl-3-methyl-5-hydroxy-6-metoxy-1,4-benzoquinol methylase
LKPPIHNPEWSPEMQALYRHDMQEIWDRRIAPHIWNQYHNQLNTYLAFAGRQPIDILDVGCAQGTLALMLAERGHRVTAVDLRPEFLAYAQSRHSQGDVRFLVANVLEDEIPGSYDLVFANQIVEHVVYPDRLMQRLKRKLKPGGRVVVTTPNGDYVKNSLPSFKQLGDPKDWEHLQFTADGDGHFYAYRRQELVDVLVAAGLKDVQPAFFESPLISGHRKVRYTHGFVPVGLLHALDQVVIRLPWLGQRLTHQLLVTGVMERF